MKDINQLQTDQFPRKLLIQHNKMKYNRKYFPQKQKSRRSKGREIYLNRSLRRTILSRSDRSCSSVDGLQSVVGTSHLSIRPSSHLLFSIDQRIKSITKIPPLLQLLSSPKHHFCSPPEKTIKLCKKTKKQQGARAQHNTKPTDLLNTHTYTSINILAYNHEISLSLSPCLSIHTQFVCIDCMTDAMEVKHGNDVSEFSNNVNVIIGE